MRCLLIFLTLCSVIQIEAAISQGFRSIESRSGQIMVRWLEQFRVPPYLRQDEENAGLIVLNPELVAVSAERIRESMIQQLGSTDHGRDKIRFHFATGKSNPNQFQVQSTRFTNGWSYHVTISPKIRRHVWLRGCVAVFLLEMANRMVQDRSVEVPVWLIEGLTMELSESALVDLSPSFTDQIHVGGTNPSLGRVIAPQQPKDPIIATRQFLGQNVPVSATELFFPDPVHMTGSKVTLYRKSAHFFFRQLTTLRAGKASLQLFLSSLSSYLNWQQTFFFSFDDQFTTMLELEKWWSVALTDLTQLTPVGSWSVAESLNYLSRIITPAALVGQDRNEIATRQNFSLQELVAQWDYQDQQPTLEQIMNRLRVLTIYSAPRLRSIIHGYQVSIQNYLDQRQKVGFEPSRRGQARLRSDQVIRTARQQFDQLDSQRRALLTP